MMENEAAQHEKVIPNLEGMMDDAEGHGRDVVVEASPEEIREFDELGPDDEKVQKWLAKNGIGENDRIIANGNVYTARPDDFLTRDVTETAALAAATARAMVDGVETSIDQHTAEIVEEEPRITEEQAEAVGEVVLEVAEVDEPMPETSESEPTEPSGEASEAADTPEAEEDLAEHIKDLRTAISGAINHIESEGQSVGLGRRTIVENLRTSIAQLSSSLRHYDDYPTAAMRTILQNTVQGLHEVTGAAGRYSEIAIGDALKSLDVAEEALNNSEGIEGIATESLKQELGDIDSVKEDLRSAGTLVGELRGNRLAQYVNALDNIIQVSYSRQIDITEVQHIATEIELLAADGGELDEVIRKAGKSLDTVAHNLRNVRAKLPE